MTDGSKLDSYVPSDDEEFMNPRQAAYFRKKLTDWKDEILQGARETMGKLAEESSNHPDWMPIS